MRRVKLGIAAAIIAAAPGLGVAEAKTGLQFSTGVNYSSGDFGGTTDTDVIVAPFGARVTAGNWAFRASVPFVSVEGPADVTVVLDDSGGGRGSSGSGSGSGRNRPEDDGVAPVATARSGRESGLGDVSLSATYSFNDIGGSNFYSDVSGRVRLPTGDDDKGLGTGATDYGLNAEVGAELSAGGVYVQAGRRFLGDVEGLNREDGWQAGAGIWADITDKASLGAGYDWRESSTPTGDDPSEVNGYATYQLTKAVRVGLNVSAGLNDASADFGAGLSLVFRPQERRN
jgi:hypothetical protein